MPAFLPLSTVRVVWRMPDPLALDTVIYEGAFTASLAHFAPSDPRVAAIRQTWTGEVERLTRAAMGKTGEARNLALMQVTAVAAGKVPFLLFKNAHPAFIQVSEVPLPGVGHMIYQRWGKFFDGKTFSVKPFPPDPGLLELAMEGLTWIAEKGYEGLRWAASKVCKIVKDHPTESSLAISGASGNAQAGGTAVGICNALFPPESAPHVPVPPPPASVSPYPPGSVARYHRQRRVYRIYAPVGGLGATEPPPGTALYAESSSQPSGVPVVGEESDPWYKRPGTWIAVGGVLALGVGAVVIHRRKRRR